jgi:glutamate synthase (NADPH) small chain
VGKPTGFLEWHRKSAPKRPVHERVGDWREFYLERGRDESARQGGRCMDCGVPFCQQGCPLGNHIPDWNELVYRDQWQRAIVALHSTNNFPEFTGRLCPAPCEAACVLAINDDAVTIEQMEREIVERAFAEGWIQPRLPAQRTGRRVGVVGSGPAGLAAAAQLNQAGHEVTVYEKADRLGGLLRYGIPDFKMEKWVIDRRVDLLRAEGVRFETGVHAGQGTSWAELRAGHDALLIAIGAERSRPFDVPGAELEGVHLAMDFLTQQNRRVAGDPEPEHRLWAEGKTVVVLGGGDTGSDCVGTAHRQGAREVINFELFPTPPLERAKSNPWPQWPMVYKVSSSHEEGGTREYAVMTTHLSGSNGRLEHLHCVRTELKTHGVNGSGPRLVEVPGTEFTVDVEMVLLAIGFAGPVEEGLKEQLGLELNRRGTIQVEQFRTSADGVYATGDAARGQSLIVWAISDGREAARVIDQDLRQAARPWLPTRGDHKHFGGR